MTVTLRLLASHSTDVAEVGLSKGTPSMGVKSASRLCSFNFLKHEDDFFFTSVLTTVDNGKVTRKAQAASHQQSQTQVVVVQVSLEPRNDRERVMDTVVSLVRTSFFSIAATLSQTFS